MIFPSLDCVGDFLEMHMTVPETSNDYLAGAIDHPRRFRDFPLVARPHGSDPAVVDEHPCIVDGLGRGRWIYPGAEESA